MTLRPDTLFRQCQSLLFCLVANNVWYSLALELFSRRRLNFFRCRWHMFHYASDGTSKILTELINIVGSGVIASLSTDSGKCRALDPRLSSDFLECYPSAFRKFLLYDHFTQSKSDHVALHGRFIHELSGFVTIYCLWCINVIDMHISALYDAYMLR